MTSLFVVQQVPQVEPPESALSMHQRAQGRSCLGGPSETRPETVISHSCCLSKSHFSRCLPALQDPACPALGPPRASLATLPDAPLEAILLKAAAHAGSFVVLRHLATLCQVCKKFAKVLRAPLPPHKKLTYETHPTRPQIDQWPRLQARDSAALESCVLWLQKGRAPAVKLLSLRTDEILPASTLLPLLMPYLTELSLIVSVPEAFAEMLAVALPHCTKLARLDLNSFSYKCFKQGTLELASLYVLSKLLSLALRHTRLTGNIGSHCSLSKLTQLTLFDLEGSSNIAGISNSCKLQRLKVSYNMSPRDLDLLPVPEASMKALTRLTAVSLEGHWEQEGLDFSGNSALASIGVGHMCMLTALTFHLHCVKDLSLCGAFWM